MSSLSSQATVELLINGQQAQRQLSMLRENALALETAIAKAAAAGNKVELKRLRRELNDTKKQIREMESSTMQVEQVLLRLDKATPRELSKTLATLNKQLDYMERGSDAWNKHVEKIRRVKAEIAAVNDTMRVQEGFATRLNRIFNEWGTAIMGAAAAMTGLIMAGRSAVKAYADMDEELTNTRKYTGMAEKDVLALNDAFKKMDTRTSRDQLNELAQEAGRLGKNTLESVQGYVEAADIINVALVDLGAGATQTIAKLTNIFGVEKLLGTRDAMLAVGSTVNVLSQNCTASKTYLVEFAQRMAGIGAQANMTIPEILAFGATLDANGQKTEMSSSALSKLIMMLNQRPEELSKAVGLNAKAMKELLKSDTTAAVIKFLEQIQKLGSKDGLAVLAPLFEDMGMEGVRMSQVLATLAEHLDMVKWEIDEANTAFKEMTSASEEYKLFNNTVQAGLDKAKKRVAELAIELGEKLLPVMKHVVSSGTMMLRALNLIVDFFIMYKREIVSVTAVLAAYTIGVNASAIATRVAALATAAWNTIAGVATGITKGYTAAMVLSRDALAGCSLAHQRLYKHMLSQNVITKLLSASTLLMRTAYYACTLQLSAMSASLKSLYVVMAANPYGVILAALTAVGVAIYNNNQKKKEQLRLAEEEQMRQRELMKDYDEATGKIKFLTGILNDNTRELDDRKRALNALKKIAPDYHADLTTEGELINNNTEALDEYLKKLKESILMKANREKLEQLYVEQQNLTEQADVQRKEYRNTRNQNTLQGYDRNALTSKIARFFGIEEETNQKEALDKTEQRLEVINKQIAELESKVTPEVMVSTDDNTVDDDDEDDIIIPISSDDKKNTDKFEKEKEWKEKEEALNRIAYATGQKDFEEYTARMNDISAEFYKKELEHTDLGETERLSIEAQYYEALKKIKDAADGKTLEEENKNYDEQVAQLKQRYIDGESTTEQYHNAMELAELAHLRRMVRLTKEGTAERLKAEKAYQDKLISNQQKRQKEAEEALKKHQEELAKVKEDAFGDNPSERRAKYNLDLALLKEVYQAELLAAGDNAKEKLRIEEAFQRARIALIKKYNIKGEKANKNFLQDWDNAMMEFLDSDLGKAVQGSVETLVSGMSSLFQGLTSIVQSEMEIQTAEIDKKYERELSLAEGNNFIINRLEKQKEEEKAKVKKEANKKMFAMQVIQAVAQTAVSALNAYSSAAAIPVIGWIMAPIAAATAIAAGAVQIAAIKKQQQASEATGYASGGFTPKGAKNEEVGVVHAGEWVASQELLASPVARPLINALDYAQRTNTIGSLRADDVSSTITAPMRLANSSEAYRATPQRVVVENTTNDTHSNETLQDVADVIGTLKRRLDEPFITVNSVTGDTGMKQAQEEYDRLMRNKTPKSRRNAYHS